MIEIKEETYHGLWYLPDSQRKVQGHLIVTYFIIELHLTDANNRKLDDRDSIDSDEVKYPVIHGLGQYGEKITLYDCSGLTDSFSAKLMLYGDRHYDNFNTQKFKILGVHIPFFDGWISSNSFSKVALSNGFAVNYNEPERINISLSNTLDIGIDFECFCPSTEKRNKITLHQFSLVHFIVKDGDGMILSELFRYVLYFQQLVSFLAQDGANVSAVRVYSDEQEYRRDRFLGTMIYGGVPFNKFEYPRGDLRKYLISKSDVNGSLGSFIKNWFDFAARAQHILKLVFLDYFYRGAFDENNFLNLVRALEIYHIYKYPIKLMPEEDFKRKLADIIAGVPDEYKKEVKEHLAFKNELTLDQRLTMLFSEVDGNKIGFDYIYDDNFKRKVKNARNYYTHYSQHLKEKAVDGEDLEFLTVSCRALINYLLLKHLGVSETALAVRFEYYIEHSYYSNYFL